MKEDTFEDLEKNDFHITKRLCVEALEHILLEPLNVLDHGFIRVVDYMGGDESIVQAARVSYGKGTKKISQDIGLIRYLMRHWHTTPFEMCEIKFHIKLPIFVARQWIRHRTASVNEYSARYSILDKEFYLPDPNHLGPQQKNNRQGRDGAFDIDTANKILDILKNDAIRCYDHYEYLLNEEEKHDHCGLSRELARMNLPVNFYTQWYWKINLHNLLHFLRLRADDHAQYEIQIYAKTILEKVIKKWVPVVYQAFLDYRLGSYNLCTNSIKVVQQLLRGEKVTFEDSKMSKREWEELHEKLNILPS
jgi:thymidylate synthase (FAD)